MGHRPDWNNKNFKKNSVPGFADGTPGGVDEREAASEGFTVDREPTVDTYEYGRYEEMQANKDRYEAESKARDKQMDRDAQEAARELSNITQARKSRSQSFSEAFAENRKAGNKTFEWNGKQYSTEMAKPASAARDYGDETERMKARAPKPAPKPEPRKFMGMEVVETDAQRKASEAYKAANPFLKGSVKRGQAKGYK